MYPGLWIVKSWVSDPGVLEHESRVLGFFFPRSRLLGSWILGSWVFIFVIFKIRQLLWSDCFLFYDKVYTIKDNVLYYESHFACQFISKTFSVIKIGFHNSKVKAGSFLLIIMIISHFSQICPLRKLLKGTARI